MADKPTLVDAEGLHSVGNLPTDRIADVVFIHGFRGGCFTTWMADEDDAETFWPTWIAEQCPKLGVWTYDFRSSVLDWSGKESDTVGLARSFLLDLAKGDVGKLPLAFVTHSLGGIVTKKSLTKAMEFPNGQFVGLAENTVGIEFIAVPHRGAKSAKWVSFFTEWLKENELVKELKWDSSGLEDLHEGFRAFFKKRGGDRLFIQSISERDKLEWNKWFSFEFPFKIVDHVSANAELGEYFCWERPGDHIAVCKPQTREDKVVSDTIYFLKESFRKVGIEPSEYMIEKGGGSPSPYDSEQDESQVLESICGCDVDATQIGACQNQGDHPCKMGSQSICLIAELTRTIESTAEIRDFARHCLTVSRQVDIFLEINREKPNDEAAIGLAMVQLKRTLDNLTTYVRDLKRHGYDDDWKDKPTRRLSRFASRRLLRGAFAKERARQLFGLRRHLYELHNLLRELDQTDTSWQEKGHELVTKTTYGNLLLAIQMAFSDFDISKELNNLADIVVQQTCRAVKDSLGPPNPDDLPKNFATAITKLPYKKHKDIPGFWKEHLGQ
ncbi:MAG: hypothetical protein KOO62_13025 [candidate division Zixibacteria bacterium]|nr:hypothetical protein [candidate division Zixibacteria bacterium]